MEPEGGYDAVHNSGKLLTILRRHGFHVILHGHKHDPYVFTEDSRSAFRKTDQTLSSLQLVARLVAASFRLTDRTATTGSPLNGIRLPDKHASLSKL